MMQSITTVICASTQHEQNIPLARCAHQDKDCGVWEITKRFTQLLSQRGLGRGISEMIQGTLPYSGHTIRGQWDKVMKSQYVREV